MGEIVIKSIKIEIDADIWEEIRVLGIRQKQTVAEVVSGIIGKEIRRFVKKGEKKEA